MRINTGIVSTCKVVYYKMPEYSDAEIMEIKKEALEEGKLSFKEVLDAVARNRTTPSFGYCKKPDKFRLGQDDITRYIDRWDFFFFFFLRRGRNK